MACQHYLFTSCFYSPVLSGARLVTTAANRLQEENQRFALITACADGGLAHACILERYDNK
jgi:acetyl-CoA acyltransferase